MSETAWLRGVVESATPGEWRAEVRTMEVAPGSGDFYSLVGIMPAEHFVGDAEHAEPDARAWVWVVSFKRIEEPSR